MNARFSMPFMVAILAAAPSFAASPLTIHGYHPGMPQSSIKIAAENGPLRAENGIVPPTCTDANSLNCANMDTFTCQSEGNGVSSCYSNFKITYGPDWVGVTLDFMDAKCVAILITKNSPDLFETRIAALESKYGKPNTDDESQIENHMGATFTDRTVTWVKDGNTLMAKKYSYSVDRGSVSLINIDAFREYVARKGAAKTGEYSDSM